ncbi:erythromycin esterase family protein [Kitasatospora misakiensis]|uniref:Erythromycin esterase family protein n=1 Tax=Kitasatospora misakiensis TaxID=67330 RepID=A0ABW0X6B1_9ACTN
MTQDIRDLVPASCGLVAFGEPTHQEPAFGRVRNELFTQLVDRGFRSIALETDRVAALAVDAYVRDGIGSLDRVLGEGFSHGFGAQEPNRRLVTWMREYNRTRPAAERLAFHGFDAPTENTSAPSPRPYLEHARDYLGLGLDLDFDVAGTAGDDDRWSRTEAVMDAAESPGATADADRLRAVADDLLGQLHARAPELIENSSREEWERARTHLTAGIGLLRYHRQAARPMPLPERLAGLLATRDAIMAQNLFDIRSVEARRGGTLVFAHNAHLQRNPAHWRMGETDVTWNGAGRIVAALVGGEEYFFVAGSLGPRQPAQDAPSWSLTPPTEPPRTTTADPDPELPPGYFPLDAATVAGADALLYINDAQSLR